jgi:pimeloyl-ACP methyl ester carboxylesterase
MIEQWRRRKLAEPNLRNWIAIVTLGLLFSWQTAIAQPGEKVQLEYEGKRLNGWLTEVDSPRATVLMIHGTMAHANMEIMTTFAEVLAEYDIASLRVTLSLGEDDREGMYDCAAEHRHTHTGATGEIAAWMDWLDREGRDGVVLLGHSRGTNQVMRFSARHAPDRAAGVVLVAPWLYRAQAVSTDYEETAGQPLAPILERAQALVDEGKGDTRLTGVHLLYCPDAEVSAEAFLSYYRNDEDFDTLALAAAGTAPVLVIVGTEDPISEGVEEVVGGADPADGISLLVVEGADHFFRDLYAYDVVEGIVAWLDSVQAE